MSTLQEPLYPDPVPVRADLPPGMDVTLSRQYVASEGAEAVVISLKHEGRTFRKVVMLDPVREWPFPNSLRAELDMLVDEALLASIKEH